MTGNVNTATPRTSMKAAFLLLLAVAAGPASLPGRVRAGEVGHFTPGLLNIRDFVVPDPGFYGVLYNYWYSSDRLNDRNGNKVSSITIGPGPGLTLNVGVDLDLYAVVPTFIWVSNWKSAGAKYAAFIAPSFANSSISAALATETGRGINASTSSFGVGDLFVQPIWLGWSPTHWDFAVGYGFYAPVGKYNTDTVTLPAVGTFTTTSTDNIGLGFWTQQIQGAVSWYPWADKRMAVCGALTYEIHGNKKDFDLTPGQDLTLNRGISQYLPLTQDQKLMLEVGPAGYDSWQITDDSGRDARNPSVHDQVHAVGGQLGLMHVPSVLALNFHGFYEYAARDRFQGASFGVNITKRF
jgi:hypothetical protein